MTELLESRRDLEAILCQVGGRGLGLHICRELVSHMGGRVTLEPNGSKRSSFIVELPVAVG